MAISRPSWSYVLLVYTCWHLHRSVSHLLEAFLASREILITRDSTAENLVCLPGLASVRVPSIRECQCASRISMCQLVVIVFNLFLPCDDCLNVGNGSCSTRTTYATYPVTCKESLSVPPPPDCKHPQTGMHLGNLNTPFFLRHGGPLPKVLHQSGLTMGKMSVHGEPKFSEGQLRVFTNLVRVKTLHELHHGPEKVRILVEAISAKDAKGYIAYTKAT